MVGGDRLMSFDQPISFVDADVGRCVEGEMFESTSGVDNLVLTTSSMPSFTVVVTPFTTPSTTPVGWLVGYRELCQTFSS